MLWWFLLYNNANQSLLYIDHLPFEPPSPPSTQTSRSSQCARLGFLSHTGTSRQYLFYTWQCIYVYASFSICATFSFPHCVRKSVLYSVPSLNIGASISFLQIPYVYMWCWRRLLRVPWTARTSYQSILKEISPDYSLEGLIAEAETPILWPPDVRNQLIGKDPDAGKD